MKKKFLYVPFCIVTMILLLIVCTKSSGNFISSHFESSNYKDFIIVDVYDEFANYQGIQGGWFAKVVKDKFNMELNIIAPNVTGNGDTLYQTRQAAGNLGDLILINTSNGKFNEIVKAGLVADCTKLVQNKDIMKNYGDAVIKTNELVEADGIYGFPKSISSQAATEASEGTDPTFGPYIRWDYYKKLGYPEMNNLEDFLDVLEKMQILARKEENSNDIYAISLFKDWDYNMMNNAKQIACMYGYDEQGFVLSKANGSNYQNILSNNSLYIKALKFFNEANARGLVDPDSPSQNYDEWIMKYEAGKVLYGPWPWIGERFNTAENKALGKAFKMAPVKDMKIFSFGCYSEGDSTNIIAIGSRASDPQRLLDFIDWLYSPEGFYLNGQANGAAGPEGLTWEIGDDGMPRLTEFGKKALPNNPVDVPEEYGGEKWDLGISALNFKTINQKEIDPNTGAPYDYLCWESTIKDNRTDIDIDWINKMGADTAMEYLKNNNMLLIAPGANYSTPAESTNITTIRERCKSAIIRYSWRMIFAQKNSFNKLLKEMQDTAKGLGYNYVYKVDLKNAKDQTAARNVIKNQQ